MRTQKIYQLAKKVNNGLKAKNIIICNSVSYYKISWQETTLFMKNEFMSKNEIENSKIWHGLPCLYYPLINRSFFTVSRSEKLIKIASIPTKITMMFWQDVLVNW